MPLRISLRFFIQTFFEGFGEVYIALIGQTNKNKKLILDKNEHPWVVKMFEWYSEGLSPKKIKHKLDGNIPTRRGNLLWSYGSVESVLTNTHHNGYYVCYGEHIKCPRGVDEILYEKVQKRRKRTVRTTLNGDNKWKDESTNIRNLLVCGNCNLTQPW